MKTDDLIDGLVADGARPTLPLGRGFALAVLVGAVVAAALFAVTLGPRPDFAQVMATPRFLLKFVETGLLAVAATTLAVRLARPGADGTAAARVLVVVALLLGAAVVVELVVVPGAEWGRRLVGRNWIHCLLLVPLLSLAPFAALMAAARHGAPTRPHLAGAVVGLASAGIGAFLYAANCTDDSPLFVATWYGLAVAAMAGIGAVVGGRVLRW